MAETTIVLKGPVFYDEADLESAADPITPGMLVERSDATHVQTHQTVGGNAAPLFARENTVIGDDIDDAYTVAEEPVQLAVCSPGAVVYARLDTGNDIAFGDLLESDGDGNLQKHTPRAVNEGGAGTYTIYLKAPVAKALEAIDNDPGVAVVRIKVEVL